MIERDHDLVAAYSLDALTSEDRTLYEAHLAECPACQAEVAALQKVVGVLPLAVDATEPSTGLRARIVEAVMAEPDSRPMLSAIPGGAAPRQPHASSTLATRLLAIAAVAAILALGLWNLRLQQQINQQQSQVAYQQQIRAALVSGAAVSQIPGTSAAPTASAALVQPLGNKPAYFIFQGLPSTPAHKVYELWLVRGTVAHGVRVFTYTGSSPKAIHLPVAATGYQIAAVTAEPAPRGSRQPTSPKLLAGRVRI